MLSLPLGALATLVVFAVTVSVLARATRRAPKGFEDEAGFHFGDDPHRR